MDLQSVSVPISSAQILGSGTGRVTILPAIPRKVILPVLHMGIYTARGTGYNLAAAGSLIVGVPGDPATPDISLVGLGTRSAVVIVDGAAEIAGSAFLEDWYEQPILWGFTDGNPTTGNGTFVWNTWYVTMGA